MYGRLLYPRASSYKVASVRFSTGDEAHLNRIHCDADGFYLGLLTGYWVGAFLRSRAPCWFWSAVVNRVSWRCMERWRMSDLVVGVAFVGAVALIIAAIYVAATS